ncbi:hypothetical protein Pro02_05080 [Planobispora rosea]|uniref:Uncharacterized protein n=2 Tax=Planobispora rosea TaxID=35762 RepID=A0A8J3WAH2_PLARO|nr:hypothetical protein Pro02_05080 [Planobispora rosea]
MPDSQYNPLDRAALGPDRRPPMLQVQFLDVERQDLRGPVQTATGVTARFGIGVVAALRFVAAMIAGSVTDALLSGLLLGVIPGLVLILTLALVLLISAIKLARHPVPGHDR